jgi:hypothetical protein
MMVVGAVQVLCEFSKHVYQLSLSVLSFNAQDYTPMLLNGRNSVLGENMYWIAAMAEVEKQ